MVDRLPNAARPSSGSLLQRAMARRAVHPDSFDCGVRVTSGRIPREGRRWRYRRSAVDPLIAGEVITVQHGARARLRLRVRPSAEPAIGSRPGFVVLAATEAGTGARIEVCVHADEAERFGVDLR